MEGETKIVDMRGGCVCVHVKFVDSFNAVIVEAVVVGS